MYTYVHVYGDLGCGFGLRECNRHVGRLVSSRASRSSLPYPMRPMICPPPNVKQGVFNNSLMKPNTAYPINNILLDKRQLMRAKTSCPKCPTIGLPQSAAVEFHECGGTGGFK